MPLTQVPPALLTSTTGTGSTVVLSASPSFTGTVTTPGVTFSDASSQTAAASPYVLKNRIINGDMRIDQRNAGAATANTISGYTLDRWQVIQSVTGKLIAQQNAAAVTPPTGFTNYLGVTSQSSYSILTGDYYAILQPIEGYNIADLDFGKATAKTVTLSFWVRSSLTGTFSGSLRNSAADRSFPFTYTISVANTWELKSVTIAGDTSGTWLTTNGIGLYIWFSLGTGSTYSGTAGAWAATNYVSATGATSVVGTNGATFYITGVQLEQNTSATPFERRLYGQELANCQRYYYTIGGNNSFETFATGVIQASNNAEFILNMPVTMRGLPTATIGGTAGNFIVNNNSSFTPSVISFDIYALNTLRISATISGATAGNGTYLRANNTLSAKINVSAEL
jgi:hypothetical protein